MKPVLWRASLRHLSRHPWQLVLAIVGVSLGVAAMVSIDVANGSALRAFELSSEAVSGKATHQIEGGATDLPERLYRDLRVDLGIRPSAPIVESHVFPITEPQRVLRILGLDPFAEAPFRTYVDQRLDTDLDLADFLTRPGAALLAAETAVELGLRQGDSFVVDAGGSERRLELVAVIDSEDRLRRAGLADLIIVDIATAQEVLDLAGRLTRIDLIVPDDAQRHDLLARIAAQLPADARIVSTTARSDIADQMTRAFRLNLQALSLLALLCGAFLIYNTMTFTVVQRRKLLATLRALGTTRRQILLLILGEALLIGLIGIGIGTIAGLALGRALVGLVTQTINDFYFVLSVREVAVEYSILVKGALVGLGTTLAAALAPGMEANTATPREALLRSELEARAHRAVPKSSLVAVCLASIGIGCLLWPGESLVISLIGLFAVLMGMALLTPVFTLLTMALITPLAGRLSGQLGRLATRGVTSALSRTGIAIAALMIALSVTVGVDLMVRSFRGTVESWLEYSLPADLYVSIFTTPARRVAGLGSTFDENLVERLGSLPGVRGINSLRHFNASFAGRQSRALAFDLDPLARSAFAFKQRDADNLWPRFDQGEIVFVSESFAYRTGIEVGSQMMVSTPDGPRDLEVAGIFYDYSSEQGVVMMSRRLYKQFWHDDQVTAISIHARTDADLSDLRRQIETSLGEGRRARVISNSELREESLRVFDRTFLITGVLRLLAVLVAFVGVLSALMALQLERTRELGILRALGLTPGQIWSLVTHQTGLMGLTAGLLALPVGLVMATIMIYVINRRSFGWSLTMEVSITPLLQALGVALLAALLAGLYPAWRMARTSPAESLRDE